MPFFGQTYSRNHHEYKMVIGESRCDTFSLIGPVHVDQSMSEEKGNTRHFKCKVFQQEAAYYNTTLFLENNLLKMDFSQQLGAALPFPGYEYGNSPLSLSLSCLFSSLLFSSLTLFFLLLSSFSYLPSSLSRL